MTDEPKVYPKLTHEEMVNLSEVFGLQVKSIPGIEKVLKPRVSGKAKQIEALGGTEWAKHYFPHLFTRPFAEYQTQFWEWGWAVEPDTFYRPRIECEPRGIGKCLAGDTQITLSNGNDVAIKDIYIGDEILSFNEISGQFERDTIKFKWPSGQKECVRITTKGGKSVTLTADHQVYTFEGWKRAGDLTVTDRIASPRRKPVFTIDDSHTDEAVRLTAYMVAEGATTSTNCSFTNADQVIVDDFYACAEAEGFTMYKNVRYRHDLTGGGREWGRQHGIMGKKAIHKRLPSWVFQLPEHQKWQFLSALIDTDGWISKGGRLGITLANKPLVEDIQNLFLQVGVTSFVLFKPNDKNNAHELLVDQECLPRCVEFMTLRLKGLKLNALLDKRRYSLMDIYPHSVIQFSGLTRKVRQAKITRIDNKYDVTRTKLRTLIAFQATERWEWLEQAEVFWDKVKKVEAVGTLETFDVEVTKNHNLISNNLISHNSTNGEVLVASLIARRKRRMVAYVSLEESKASRHFDSIKAILENDNFLKDYPHCKPKIQKLTTKAESWSRDAIVTESDAMIVPLSLQGSSRGWKSPVGARFDMIVLDDIDKLGMSPIFIKKLLELLKGEILAAGDDQTLVLGLQNLIHRDSIVTQIYDGRADILSDRIFCGPFPLLKNYEAEKVDIPGDMNGAKRWTITSGEVFDPALSIEYAEKLLNTYGRSTFDRECQQLVFKVDDEKDFREWDEVYHVITYTEFVEFFKQNGVDLWSVARKHPNIPQSWNVGLGLDWGTTILHPTAVACIARPPQNCVLNDCFFAFTEIVLPRFPHSVGEEVPLVSPGRVARALQEGLAEWNVAQGQIRHHLMSHEASAALNTMRVDLQDDLKTFFNKWHPKRGSGVPQVQNMLEIDYSKHHPFRKDVMGRPRLFFIVPDEQGRLINGELGNLNVAQPIDYKGFARARYEMPLYSYQNGGQSKTDDDFVDALLGLANVFMVPSNPLSKEEKRERSLPASLQNVPQILATQGESAAVMAHRARQLAFAELDRAAAEKKRAMSKYRPSVPKFRR